MPALDLRELCVWPREYEVASLGLSLSVPASPPGFWPLRGADPAEHEEGTISIQLQPASAPSFVGGYF